MAEPYFQSIQKSVDHPVLEEIKKLVEQEQEQVLKTAGKPISAIDAQQAVFKRNPDLFERWRAASFRQ